MRDAEISESPAVVAVLRVSKILLRFDLWWHERTIDQPFGTEASDLLDAALVARESRR